MFGFSIIVPVYNETGNIKNLVNEIFSSLKNYDNFELIIVDDGSKDSSLKVLNNIKNDYPIIILKHNNNLGQSHSILTGIKNSNYNVVVTIDGDGQNNPYDIPKLLNIYFSNKNYFLVGGIRSQRKDSQIKIVSSRIANYIRSFILKDDCIDTGCSLKVFDKDIFLKIPFFDGIHRFLPALYKGHGYETYFTSVDHRPRKSGSSKYGTFNRLFKGIGDILKVIKIINLNKKKYD